TILVLAFRTLSFVDAGADLLSFLH
ncbi:hypothetical protein A2U01_0113676, partial [Trifolium medium]|nr:hypothetical protein [Trifolium medium]